MPSSPVRTHSFNVTSSPTSLSPSLHTSYSSLPRLPSLHPSASFTSPSVTSLHHPSTPKLPWSGEKTASTSTRNSESRRSVRWSDSTFSKDSRSSINSSSKNAVDPASMWARYTQTVRPKFQLYEPSCGRLEGRGRERTNGHRLAAEREEDSKYAMKMSLPCPRHSGCCFCVYSRQLGPVRIYFSNFSRRKLQSGHRPPRRNGTKHAELSRDVSEEPDQQAKKMLLKEPWMTSSAPSGEVIVPVLPSEVDRRFGQQHVIPKSLSSELADARKLKGNSFRKNQRTFTGVSTTSKSGQWVTSSAPPESNNHSSFLPKDSRHPRSITFCEEDMNTGTYGEPFLLVPRNTPRSLGTLPVKVKGRSLSKRDLRDKKSPAEGLLSGPPVFPSRDLSASQRLLSKRPIHP